MESGKERFKKIKWFFFNLFNALFNDANGFSLRKCISLVVVKVGLYIQIINTDKSNLTSVLIIDFSFAALLIGIVTVQNIIDFKNGKQ